MATNAPVTLDTPIVVKILFRGQTKKFKLPLKDLGAHVLPDKLRSILGIANTQEVVFERYSDSAAAYVTLKADSPQVYKTLFRAAKAKLKLRLKASIPGEVCEAPAPSAAPVQQQLPNLSSAIHNHQMSSDTLVPQNGVAISPVIAQTPDKSSPVPKAENIVTSSQPMSVDHESETPGSPSRVHYEVVPTEAKSESALAFRPKPTSACATWVVYCNNCNQPMENEHFHCSVCDQGDYDLCPACVDTGIHCPGKGHWMVKRFVKNGCVINSTTQRIPPKAKTDDLQEVPGAFTEEKAAAVFEEEPTRTCNCCVNILPEKEFVTCIVCDDFDLCLECHISNRHGHHPAHGFEAAAPDTVLPTLAEFLCNQGRNVRHAAVCDGCDKFIYGVRHKCLNCPDWDYCSECIKNANMIHPRHRFIPVYEPLTEPPKFGRRHYGIYCDGPLCKDKENLSYIQGIRYKCAVCHDTDFCANCEAHPSNTHNKTHPLLKFRTPVRNVSVTTTNEDHESRELALLGDQLASHISAAAETAPAAPPCANAATQVHTIVDLKPSAEVQAKKEKITIQDLLADPVNPLQQKAPSVDADRPSKPMDIPASKSETAAGGLDGHFVRDTIVDGSKIYSGFQFVQVWTMRNPGPEAWPAGCSVRHVGGDNMLNIDNTRPLSHPELAEASESNVYGHPVQPGEEATFRVVMKAPQREGTAISYWRLKTADGMPFGHRLWCDIRVVSPPTPVAPLNASAPPPLYERLHQARLERMRLPQPTGTAVKNPSLAAFQQQILELETMKKARAHEARHESDKVQALLQQQQRFIQSIRQESVARIVESQRKQQEAALASDSFQAINSTANASTEVTTEATVPEPVEDEDAKKIVPELHSSHMVFPRLDTESPESSTYDSATTVQPESPASQKSTAARTVTVASDDEFFEDAESVALHSEDEGFLTDEEYDILDVSDEEIV